MGKSSLLSLGVILVDGGVCPQMDPQRLIESEGEKILRFFLTCWVPVPCVHPQSFHFGASKTPDVPRFLGWLGCDCALRLVHVPQSLVPACQICCHFSCFCPFVWANMECYFLKIPKLQFGWAPPGSVFRGRWLKPNGISYSVYNGSVQNNLIR